MPRIPPTDDADTSGVISDDLRPGRAQYLRGPEATDLRRRPAEKPEHFAPELVQLLLRATNGPLTVSFTTKRNAFRLRQRIYKLRKALMAAGHPQSDEFARLQISVEEAVEDGARKFLVHFDTKDKDLVEEIRRQIPDLDDDFEELDPEIAKYLEK